MWQLLCVVSRANPSRPPAEMACRGPERRERKREYSAKPAKVGLCKCGAQFNPASNGRPYTTCERCRRPPPGANKQEKQCPVCRGIFISARQSQACCSKRCGESRRLAALRMEPLAPRPCKNCGEEFRPKQRDGMFCKRQCKQADWAKRNPVQARQCAYFAKHCVTCGRAGGRRRDWTRCAACVRDAELKTARQAARMSNEALHRAAGKVDQCDECGCSFCRLYGAKPGLVTLCQVCAPLRRQRSEKLSKSQRKARLRGAGATERVSPNKVFERDGWCCYLCGRETPKGLRGSMDGRAPELEHVEPLSRGGAHTMANARCACRRCNGIKADHPLVEALRRIAEELRDGEGVGARCVSTT